MSMEQKVQVVVNVLENRGLPFLASVRSLAGIKRFLSQSESSKFGVYIKLKRLLRIGDA